MASSEIPATSEVLLKTDASKQFLDALLGQGWDQWGQGLGGEESAELMLQIFSAFNLVALAIISALFLWVMALAVAGTAHEGVPFGKRYSSLWMPVRFVGAMGALAPIFKGLSLFQVALLACMGWSINLGNYVWDLGVNYFVERGGQMTVQAPDQNVTRYSELANGTLKSLTLQYYLAERRGMNITPGGPGFKYSGNLIQRGGEYKFIFNGDMGTITVDCISPDDALCIGKANAVGTAITSLSAVAQQLADPDLPDSAIDRTALYKAANAINETILKGLQSYAKQGQLKSKLRDFQDTANQYGWFIAGSSYWSISWINQETREAMYSGIRYSPPEQTLSEWLGITHGLQDAEAVRLRVDNYIKTAYASRRGISDTTADPSVTDEEWIGGIVWGKIKSFINNTFAANMLPLMMERLSKYDPIMALSDFGDYIIGIAQGLIVVLSVASLGKMAEAVISFALFSVVLPFFVYGIMLAFYLPAIPFIRWVSALAGWVILIVESLIAAPLWICAHALPEGEGAAGQHGKRGYMLFLGILLRPPLMVAGFFCAVILINVLGKLIGQGFEMFIAGTSQTKMIGGVGSLAMSVILGTVVIVLANKFFSLIHYLPEHVTNWIGQQFHNLGEKEDQSAAKGVLNAGASVTSETRGGAQKNYENWKAGKAGKDDNNDKKGGAKAPPTVSERNLKS